MNGCSELKESGIKESGTKGWGHARRPVGFTLIELMVAISLIAIILATATPAMVNYLRQRGVREAADQIAMDLQRAKLLAVSRNTNGSILVDTAANQYTITVPGQVIETVDLARFRGEVTFTSIGADVTAPQITFTAQGLCVPSGNILITNAAGTATFRLRTTVAGGISQQILGNGNWH